MERTRDVPPKQGFDLPPTPWLLLLSAVPLLIQGQWFLGAVVVLAWIIISSCTAVANGFDENEKREIRFQTISIEEIYSDMLLCEVKFKENGRSPDDNLEFRMVVSTGLGAIARKVEKVCADEKALSSISLSSLDAVYLGYRNFDDDHTLGSALALHALLAKVEAVRQRHLFQTEQYGLDIVVRRLRFSLMNAKGETSEEAEVLAAEIERKACLLFGALSDGDKEMARLVTSEGCMEQMVNAMDWFRMHEGLVSWALWALFILCYEFAENKRSFVQLGGVSVTSRAVRNCAECTEVGRHGVALLFDLLRETEESSLDSWQIRDIALTAGLHESIIKVLEHNPGAMDIMTMGGEILAGTNYPGEFPVYTPETHS